MMGLAESPVRFQLSVQRVNQTCLFELSWLQGRRLSAQIAFPDTLTQHYEDWRTAYLTFYQTVQIPLTTTSEADGLRGRVIKGGSLIATPRDWRIQLVEAESRLLYSFHQWLRSPELYDLRAQIAQASRNLQDDTQSIDIFLSCTPLDIARLPWEAWEIGTEFAATGRIRIARIPANIRSTVSGSSHRSRHRLRILAILGDDTGLNFKVDRTAVQSLASVAEITFIGWQPELSIESLKAQIVEAIADEQGWDILFFAGHSNEKVGLGGELAIAPNTAIALNEIKPQLQVAQQRGLQFALFNSCNGMDLAETLIDLGLSQVAVMREPIHNRVAQEFLVRFLQRLVAYQDVHTALIGATEFLKTRTNLTHPSAHLVPALFRHPDSTLFRLRPFGWKQRLKAALPTRHEAIALTLLTVLSWQLPIQSQLLERRMTVQSIYRQVTQSVTTESIPPVLLVQIDDASISRAGITDLVPMDRSYLAQLVNQLTAFNAPVIGFDYLLDYPQEGDSVLAQALQSAIDQRIQLVFAATQSQNGGWLYASPDIAKPDWSQAGDMRYRRQGNTYYLSLGSSGDRPQPLSYELAIRHPNPPSSSLLLPQPTLWMQFGYGLGQMWFHPIVDFSLPPDHVYQRISAWELLTIDASKPREQAALPNLNQQVVLIVPGGYRDAGVHAANQDNLPVPAAIAYWRQQSTPPDNRPILTGGEVHAYQLHHYLHHRLVVPIPDLWMIGLAAIVGKWVVGRLDGGRSPNLLLLVTGGSLIYSLLSLQLYSSAAILVPIMFPVSTVYLYVLTASYFKASLKTHQE